jgi:hypothetical protein
VVGGGIAAAFFASLDWCSCVEVRTKEEDDDAEAMPLMDRGGSPPTPTQPTAAAATSRGVTTRAVAAGKAAGKRRGSLGCCARTTQ